MISANVCISCSNVYSYILIYEQVNCYSSSRVHLPVSASALSRLAVVQRHSYRVAYLRRARVLVEFVGELGSEGDDLVGDVRSEDCRSRAGRQHEQRQQRQPAPLRRHSGPCENCSSPPPPPPPFPPTVASVAADAALIAARDGAGGREARTTRPSRVPLRSEGAPLVSLSVARVPCSCPSP